MVPRTPVSGLAKLALAALLASGVALPEPACAQDQEDQRIAAEKFRLQEEVRRLASRNAWAGVERSYEELLKLGVELSYDDHSYGAQAARNQGKTYEMYVRLGRAQEIEERPEVTRERDAIEQTFGLVEIEGNIRKRIPLQRPDMPFAPDQRSAIEYAMKTVSETGSFKGMLPSGDYIIGAQEFTVEPGPEWQEIKVQTRGVKPPKEDGDTGPDGPQMETEGLILYMGPVAFLGGGYLSAPLRETDSYQQNLRNGSELSGDFFGTYADSYNGIGPMVTAGVEAGLSPQFALAVTAGYKGSFGGQTSSNALAFGLDAVVRAGALRITAGPSVLGNSSTYEAAIDDDLLAQGAPNGFYGKDSDTVALAERGWSAGARLGVGYAALDFGKLQGLVQLVGDAQFSTLNFNSDWGVRQHYGIGLQVGIVPTARTFKQQ